MTQSAPASQAPAKAAAGFAPVQEVFSSVQGEGIYVGRRQIFVRFAHCHLKCAYCDTPMTSATGLCHVEPVPGSGETSLISNPVSAEALLEVIQGLLGQAPHHSVSFTGGEPLLYHGFLKALFPRVRSVLPTYLETSGTQPAFLAEVLPWTDIIAMDIKLPSATGEPDCFEAHRAFYDLAGSRPETELFIKLVFTEHTTEDEILAVESIVTDRNTPIVLQPVTERDDHRVGVSSRAMLRLQDRLARHFADVRLVPQTHKMLRVL